MSLNRIWIGYHSFPIARVLVGWSTIDVIMLHRFFFFSMIGAHNSLPNHGLLCKFAYYNLEQLINLIVIALLMSKGRKNVPFWMHPYKYFIPNSSFHFFRSFFYSRWSFAILIIYLSSLNKLYCFFRFFVPLYHFQNVVFSPPHSI